MDDVWFKQIREELAEYDQDESKGHDAQAQNIRDRVFKQVQERFQRELSENPCVLFRANEPKYQKEQAKKIRQLFMDMYHCLFRIDQYFVIPQIKAAVELADLSGIVQHSFYHMRLSDANSTRNDILTKFQRFIKDINDKGFELKMPFMIGGTNDERLFTHKCFNGVGGVTLANTIKKLAQI